MKPGSGSGGSDDGSEDGGDDGGDDRGDDGGDDGGGGGGGSLTGTFEKMAGCHEKLTMFTVNDIGLRSKLMDQPWDFDGESVEFAADGELKDEFDYFAESTYQVGGGHLSRKHFLEYDEDDYNYTETSRFIATTAIADDQVFGPRECDITVYRRIGQGGGINGTWAAMMGRESLVSDGTEDYNFSWVVGQTLTIGNNDSKFKFEECWFEEEEGDQDTELSSTEYDIEVQGDADEFSIYLYAPIRSSHSSTRANQAQGEEGEGDYDDGYDEYDDYYDEGYYDEGYYDEGYYDEGYYDEGYYDDGGIPEYYSGRLLDNNTMIVNGLYHSLVRRSGIDIGVLDSDCVAADDDDR